jgi:hypothetical protein
MKIGEYCQLISELQQFQMFEQSPGLLQNMCGLENVDAEGM